MATPGAPGEGSKESLQHIGRGVLERGRDLALSYAKRGFFSADERLEASRLSARGSMQGLPTKPGSQLQSALYLVRVGLDVLGGLARDDKGKALRKLKSALLDDQHDAAALEPFDGLLFVVGARLAHECGDAGTEQRMVDGACLIAARLGREADAVVDLLRMVVPDEGSSTH